VEVKVPYYPAQTATPNIGVSKNGTLIGSRPNINLIEGSQVSLTVTDDAPNTEVDVTIASTAGGVSSAGAILQGVLGTYNEGCVIADYVTSVGSAYNTTTSVLGGANRAIYIPVQLNASITAYQMAWLNGGVVAGTIDVGIYNSAGTLLVSSTPQTQTTINVVQAFNVTDTPLTPDTYYLGLAVSSATAQFRSYSASTSSILRSHGIAIQDGLTSGTLPATATFATNVITGVPVLAVVFQSATF
jgi:hypothetical protein